MPKTKKPLRKTIKKTSRSSTRSKTLTIFGRKLTKLHMISLGSLLVFASVGAYFTFLSSAALNDFTKVGTHPQAMAQATAEGKIITDLESWNGKLYSGYGNWVKNAGPIAITPFDTATNTFAPAPELMSKSHANHTFRTINGKLYTPAEQPDGGDYSVGTAVDGVASWQNPGPMGFTHAFDMVTLTGEDLWIVGSQGKSAVAWRSLDGGANWQKVLDIPPKEPVSCSGIFNFSRIYGAAVYKGKLYVQAVDWCNYAQPSSKVFDSNDLNAEVTDPWPDGPSFGRYAFNKADTFKGKLLFSTGTSGNGVSIGSLESFDGVKMISSEYGTVDSIYNYTIDRGADAASDADDTVYALTYEGEVKKSTDLITWTIVATAPTAGNDSIARSIAIHNGTIYLGGTDSAIYKHKGSGGGGSTNDTIAPTVSITSPADGSTLTSRTTIQASATDNVKVTRMEIYDGTTLLKTSTAGTIKFGWSTRNITTGKHTIIVKAHDAAGKVGEASVTVTKQ